MKRIIIFSLIILLISGSLLSAIEIDPTLARIKYKKLEVITQKQFRQQVEELENNLKKPVTLEQKKQLLEMQIDEKLLVQAAAAANISVSQTQLNQAIELYKQQLSLQLGLNRMLSDTELKTLLSQQGMTYEEFTQQIEKRAVIEQFILEKKGATFKNLPPPSEDEIKEFFESNRTKFVSPEMIKFKQIILLTKNLKEQDVGKARKKANDIYKQIQMGTSFDKFTEIYLEEGSGQKVGQITYETWKRDEEDYKKLYGKNFFDAVFKMEAGKRSQVLESSLGFHIVEVIEKIPFQTLSLEDKIPPAYNMTVKDYITKGLMQNAQAKAIQQATQELIDEIKKEADISIKEENLNW